MHILFNMKCLASTVTNSEVPHMLPPEQRAIAQYSVQKMRQFFAVCNGHREPESQEHLKKQTRPSLLCYKHTKRFLFRDHTEEEDFKAQTYYANLGDFFVGGATLVKTFKTFIL